jgi:1,4-alpha-glucan branching enzyme
MGKKVTFSLPAEVVGDATGAIVLGDFNNWNSDNGISLKKQKDGSMKVTTTLEGGRTYQYRYLLNDGRWVNDNRADEYVHVADFAVENCVISVPAEKEKKVSAKPRTGKAPAKSQAKAAVKKPAAAKKKKD